MFNNLKIGVRLGIGFALTLALLLMIAALSYTNLKNLDNEIEDMVLDKFPKTVQANSIIESINAIAQQLRNAYIYSGDEQKRSLDAIGPERQKIIENLGKLEKSITSDKGKEILARVRAARAAYITDQDKFLALLKDNKREEIVTHMQTGLHASQTAYLKAVNDLIDFQTDLMSKSGKEAEQNANRAVFLVLLVSGIAVILGIGFAWFVTRSITRPIGEALNVTRRLSEGDLTLKIEDAGKDEIGQMLAAQQALIAKLSQVIGEVKTASDALSNA